VDDWLQRFGRPAAAMHQQSQKNAGKIINLKPILTDNGDGESRKSI